jgi:hypothetical protein
MTIVANSAGAAKRTMRIVTALAPDRPAAFDASSADHAKASAYMKA